MTVVVASREFREIPIGLINPPALASRSEMDETKLEELTASIRQLGVLQPLSVARLGERYEIAAGHRRFMAATRAGLVVVPCLVYPTVDAALEAIKFAENYYREDLNPGDEALYFAQLLERDHGGDTDKLAAALGLTRAFVEQRLNLLTVGEEIFEALRTGKIGVGVAQQLARFKDPLYRRGMLKQALLGGATVAVVSGWYAEYQRSLGPSGEQTTPLPDGPIAGAGIAETFFRCCVCGGTDNVHLMQPVNVHAGHCRHVLDTSCAAYRGDA